MSSACQASRGLAFYQAGSEGVAYGHPQCSISVVRRVRQYRGADTQQMTENSPVGSSQSNVMIERSIQTVEGQIRTLRNAFEARTGSRLPTASCLFAWMVTHAGNIINLCEVGKDGKVPFLSLRGRKMHPELVEFGKIILFQPLDHKTLGSAQLRWQEGVVCGHQDAHWRKDRGHS